jgi:hypothetical protein
VSSEDQHDDLRGMTLHADLRPEVLAGLTVITKSDDYSTNISNSRSVCAGDHAVEVPFASTPYTLGGTTTAPELFEIPGGRK